jgi:hypothetical protein
MGERMRVSEIPDRSSLSIPNKASTDLKAKTDVFGFDF